MAPDPDRDILGLINSTEARLGRRMLFDAYHDEGPLRRELYGKHMEFFAAQGPYSEVGAIAGNRTGKTFMAAYASTCHITGWYPKWWPGRIWNRPTRGWPCGKTRQKTREIIQTYLFGDVVPAGGFGGWQHNPKGVTGTGMIPGEWIGRLTWQQGVPDFIDTATIKHQSGGWSLVGLKSYEQGREAFEGTKLDWIWDDEEPPADVYGEQLMRLTPTNGGVKQNIGLMLCTFTPLEGLTEVVLSYTEPETFKE